VLTSWFPAPVAEAVPELLKRARLTDEIGGYQPAGGEDWVSARPPTSAEAREFGIKRGSPVAVVHSRRFDVEGNVIEYSELIARADTRIIYRYRYGYGGSRT
jgi:DNA-binding GntR family transcriptional regulator